MENAARSIYRWRALLVCAAALGALAQAAALFSAFVVPWTGIWGAGFSVSGRPYEMYVRALLKNGPTARAGAHIGDRIRIDEYDLKHRIGIFYQPVADQPFHMRLYRNGKPVEITVIPAEGSPPGVRISYLLSFVASAFVAVIAALIGWRRADSPRARWLSLFLSASLLLGILPENFATPWTGVSVLQVLALPFIVSAQLLFFLLFIQRVATPLSRARHLIQIAGYAFALVQIFTGLISAFGLITLKVDPTLLGFQRIFSFSGGTGILVSLMAGTAAILATHGAERQFALWTIGSLAFIALDAAITLMPARTYEGVIIRNIVANILTFAAPLGLSYALLSRRLLDVGFILNRALVFALASAIIVGIFIVTEYALTEWIRDVSHATSIAVNVGLALLIGGSAQWLHSKVDQFVDAVFFRKRHENEKAIRTFARDCAFITRPQVLLDRAVETVKTYGQASEASILFLDKAQLDPDDPAIVAMRATHKPVELHNYKTELTGEFAFPMVARGALFGMLVCGEKTDGETYAPDEFDAIETLAYNVGTAVDALGQGGDEPVYERIVEELRRGFAALEARLERT